ncbi:hypothetical protein BH10BAC5_BH10BAC5_27320 [soil metagenome]
MVGDEILIEDVVMHICVSENQEIRDAYLRLR